MPTLASSIVRFIESARDCSVALLVLSLSARLAAGGFHALGVYLNHIMAAGFVKGWEKRARFLA